MLLYVQCRSNYTITWATKVKNLLSRYGFGYAWQNQGVGNEKRFLILFKSRLRDILIQEWVSDINTSSKANHYRNFYGFFEIQFYLKNTLPVYLTRILAKLRCSAHELKVEKGRHNGTPYLQRICVFCRNNQIEDEFHFVLQCPFFHDLRIRYIPQRYIKRYPNVEDFYAIMKCKNESVIARLAQYLIVAFQRRADALA